MASADVRIMGHIGDVIPSGLLEPLGFCDVAEQPTRACRRPVFIQNRGDERRIDCPSTEGLRDSDMFSCTARSKSRPDRLVRITASRATLACRAAEHPPDGGIDMGDHALPVDGDDPFRQPVQHLRRRVRSSDRAAMLTDRLSARLSKAAASSPNSPRYLRPARMRKLPLDIALATFLISCSGFNKRLENNKRETPSAEHRQRRKQQGSQESGQGGGDLTHRCDEIHRTEYLTSHEHRCSDNHKPRVVARLGAPARFPV